MRRVTGSTVLSPNETQLATRAGYYFQRALDFLGTSIGLATVLVLLGAGLIVATALSLVRVDNTNDNTNAAQAACLTLLNNQQQVLLSGCDTSTSCNICDDGNPCTNDYYTPALATCENRRRMNGAPCYSYCNKNLLGQTCQQGVCTGTCAGSCTNETDCPTLTPSLFALEFFPSLNLSTRCLAKQCQYSFVDLGLPPSGHTTGAQSTFQLPLYFGWPSDALPDKCLALINPLDTDINCLTSSYFYAGIIGNATTIPYVADGYNAFVCLLVYTCSSMTGLQNPP